MEQTTIREITIRLNDLETLILSIQNSLQSNFVLLISIMGVAIAGLGFYQILKFDVINKYEKHIDEQEKRIISKVIEAIYKEKTDWITPTLISGHTSVKNETLAYRKISESILVFKGRIVLGSSGVIAMLPKDFRPPKNIIIPGIMFTSDTDEYETCIISIESNGNIRVESRLQIGYVVIFDNILVDISN